MVSFSVTWLHRRENVGKAPALCKCPVDAAAVSNGGEADRFGVSGPFPSGGLGASSGRVRAKPPLFAPVLPVGRLCLHVPCAGLTSPEPSPRGPLSKRQVRAQSQARGSCTRATLAGQAAARPRPPRSGGLQRPGGKRTQKARVPVKAPLLSLTTQTTAPDIPSSDNYVRCHSTPSMSL